ncbi:tetratricopeptide repeat protein [Streptomyces sp. NBC_00083]|uniref:tetratricopeptide repeat protein n=1 Tax=Streptomyces sp. NBC_00083 TaxID=2975647 RepID=UPI00224CCB00|nr:tetratricopeptide repeat protein [Streptomyces sp. NBC_00083]MCX5384243.1 tetratricopeptide repeat protein [Streptomyces sp. NBC_00083]
MYGKAFAPEYRGTLGELSVNTSLEEVLAKAVEERRKAEVTSGAVELAHAGLAVAEASRRLGRVEEAEQAWKDSYRAARGVDDKGAMAWAMWSGGTLARQRGDLALARRRLAIAADLAEQGGDIVARGYSLAGLAETGRIQGDYEAVGRLHEQLLAEARRRGEARHTVWALEGIAQMHRNTGSFDRALALFEEAARIAEDAGDDRGRAWALRGIADVLSAQGDTGRALALLTEAETLCRAIQLVSALAYNHKMRGNVLFRAGRHAEAEECYRGALEEFRAMGEPRGETLARLGLVKARARQGRAVDETAADLDDLERALRAIGLLRGSDMISKARTELGVPSADATATTAAAR